MGNHRGWWWTAWRGRAKNTARISRLGGNGDSGTQYFSLRTTRPGVRVPLAALTKDAVPLNSLSGMMRIMSLCRQIGQITPFRRRLPTARNAVSARTGRPKSEFSGIAKRPFSERNGLFGDRSKVKFIGGGEKAKKGLKIESEVWPASETSRRRAFHDSIDPPPS